MWGSVSLSEVMCRGSQRGRGDIEFEIAQLEEQFEESTSEGEREELHYQISNLYYELEEME